MRFPHKRLCRIAQLARKNRIDSRSERITVLPLPDRMFNRDKVMARKEKRKGEQRLFPPDQQIAAIRKRLPIFKAHDLRSLLAEAKASQNAEGNDIALVAALRRRTTIQIRDLLRHLGVDPSRPDAWKGGFYLLAFYHHRIGHLAWHPRRSNRNAARWTPEHDYDLLREVTVLKAKGLSERRAIANIAADPKKRRFFPYREQERRHFPKGTQQERREAALWAHYQKLIASARGRSLLDLFGNVREDGPSFLERVLRDLDEVDFLRQLVNQIPSKKTS